MSKRFSQIAGVGVLLLWGGMMVYFYVSGRISVYLAQEFRIYTLVAGLGLCVLGLFNLLTRGKEAECGHDHDHDHDHGEGGHDHAHDHGAASLGVIPLVFLVVPLLVAARISPDTYSSQAVINKGLYSANYETAIVPEGSSLALPERAAEDAKPMAVEVVPLPADVEANAPAPAEAAGEQAKDASPADPKPEDPKPEEAKPEEASGYGEYTLADLEAQVDKTAEGRFLLTIPQLFYTAGDEELQRVLKDLPVETVGQVMPEKVNNEKGTRLRIFRLFIECCAADARPLSIPIEFGKGPPEHREMGWVKVTGKMSYVQEDGMTIPVLVVESMEETEPPEDEMIF